jgi:hypothetical protein
MARELEQGQRAPELHAASGANLMRISHAPATPISMDSDSRATVVSDLLASAAVAQASAPECLQWAEPVLLVFRPCGTQGKKITSM